MSRFGRYIIIMIRCRPNGCVFRRAGAQRGFRSLRVPAHCLRKILCKAGRQAGRPVEILVVDKGAVSKPATEDISCSSA